MFLYDDKFLNWESENNKRLESIENKKLWLSRFDKLNDPFEFKSLYLDRKRLEEHGWDIGFLEQIINNIKMHMLVTCFSDNFNSNMPMWAHYSNNHKGFCVEYNIINPNLIFPVLYGEKRYATASIITNLVSELTKLENQDKRADLNKINHYFTVLYLSNMVKHRSWEYEKEYRILYPEYTQVPYGKLIDNSELGIEISAIYLGINCNEDNKRKLKKISEKLECPLYQMYLDDHSDNYELKHVLC
ncbi:hypothetical protein HNQ85_001309 [Anoxybacillus calidus]|jgi:hypothetical protein|uniref:DUF2971 domain-containing protein n=1 Tax=[Anoxybacillus] calidus TaxID=575178 RepID=A0A7V9YYZ3_9BACL|nr:DUF2971 domain-containing protein [Anoxybacillus calidus]MBA2871039.1 hypothetical protein [Anoxybacillus calidus]